VTALGVILYTAPPSPSPTTSENTPQGTSSSGQFNFLPIYISAAVLLAMVSIVVYYFVSSRRRAALIAAKVQPTPISVALEDIAVIDRI